jgi:hypothetical protein
MMSRKKAVQQKTEPADEAAEVADEDGVDGVALTVLKVICAQQAEGILIEPPPSLPAAIGTTPETPSSKLQLLTMRA